ncbi:hypothetical protein ACLOJK_037325 [Asimina triloba]
MKKQIVGWQIRVTARSVLVLVLGLEVVGERKWVVAAKWDVGKGGRVIQKDSGKSDGYKEFFLIFHDAEGATL